MSQVQNVVKGLCSKPDNSVIDLAYANYLLNPNQPSVIIPSGACAHSVKLLLYDLICYCSLSFNIPCDLSLLRYEIFGSTSQSVLVK